MKLQTLFFKICLCCSLWASAQNSGTITVSVNDIKASGQGEVVFMLFNKNDGFPSERDKAFKFGVVEDFGSSASYKFENVPYGDYAISVYQDKNGDGEVESNFMGIPKEPVGASNLTKKGKPNFNKCTFSFNSSSKTIKIKFVIAN